MIQIETARLLLTSPTPDMAGRALCYVTENRLHLAPWEPTRLPSYYTKVHWEQTLALAEEDRQDDNSLHLVLLNRNDPSASWLGQCSFRSIMRGPFQACYLGYSLDHKAEGRELMFEALSAAIEYVFRDMGLHRIMANYMPANTRSERLLRRLGFAVEGYARDYLFLAGAWQDHVLTSLTNPAWSTDSPMGQREVPPE